MWMADMREACERAINSKRTVKTRLLALVFAIREELYKRADDPDAFSIFHFVLEHKPEAAMVHHKHRQDLVVKILTDAGWPQTQETERGAQSILNALRFYTDPHAVSAYRNWDFTDQIEQLVEFLARAIETGSQQNPT